MIGQRGFWPHARIEEASPVSLLDLGPVTRSIAASVGPITTELASHAGVEDAESEFVAARNFRYDGAGARRAVWWAQRYGPQNFVKAAAVTRVAVGGAPQAQTIVDAGCGWGASGLAVLAHLADFGRQTSPVHLLLIDRSPDQIETARQLMPRFAEQLPFPVDMSFSVADTATLPDIRADYVVSGFVVTELGSRAGRSFVRDLVGMLKPGGVCISYDHASDLDARRASCAAAIEVLVSTTAGVVDAEIGDHAFLDRADESSRYNIAWRTLTAPHQPDLHQATRAFLSARWRGDVTAAIALLAPDVNYELVLQRHAQFASDPLTFRGNTRHDVKRALTEYPCTQFVPRRVIYDDRAVSLEWALTRATGDQSTLVRGNTRLGFGNHMTICRWRESHWEEPLCAVDPSRFALREVVDSSPDTVINFGIN